MRHLRTTPFAIALVAALSAAGPATAQSVAARIARAPDGAVRLSYAARPEVCGNGRNINIQDSTDEWEADCEHGPVHVRLTVRGGRVTDLDTYVGGRWRPAPSGRATTDLGTVGTREIAEYLMSLGRRSPQLGHEAIHAAQLADSVTLWPELLRLARDASVPRESRKAAIFWVGQAASSAATDSLDTLVNTPSADREIGKAAVFALSQRPHGEGVPVLIRVARTHRDPEVRRRALFWLGESEDPRALALFEELLTHR